MHKVYAVNIQDIFSPARNIPTFGTLVSVILTNAFVLAGIIGLFFLVFGGITIILGAGGGESKKLEQGKQTITRAILGLVIIATSVWIVQIIGHILGFDPLQTQF